MITSVVYLIVSMTVLVIGVFSTSNRRLTTTGTIRFTPDTRAAVQVTFTISNAWQLKDNVASKVQQSEVVKNYTGGDVTNPVIGDFYHVSGDTIMSNGSIVYQNLVFDPAGAVTPTSDITLTFQVINNSARTDKPLRVTFEPLSTNALPVKSSGNKMGYVVSASTVDIGKGTSGTLTITLKLSDASQTISPITFAFGLTFGFAP